jgi:hypothetical protein
MRVARIALAGLLIAGTASAQYYPYPRVRRSNPKTTGIPGANQEVAGTLHGTLKQLTNKEVVIENQDKQEVVIRRTRKTKFLRNGKAIKPSDMDMSTAVSIDVVEDVDLKPVAVTVSVDSATAAPQTRN